MNKYEKYKMNTANNTNTSINFIMDSLNKPDFEIIKEINKKTKAKEKEKIKKTILQGKKNYIQSELQQQKAHNKLESFILSSKKKYSKYNKVPHQSNHKLNTYNKEVMYPERGSNLSYYNCNQINALKSIVSESNESKYIKTIKNSHSSKKTIKAYENKYTINKYLKKNLYNSSYKKNNNLKPKVQIQINEQKFNSFKKVPKNKMIKAQEVNPDELINDYLLLNNIKNDTNNNFDNNHPLYVIDDEQNNIYQNINNPKKYSTKNDYDLIINNNENNNINNITFELLKLNERKWLKELDDISNLLIEKRDNLDDNIYNKYIHKMVKIHEHFNWLVNSIGRYFNSIIYENIQNNNNLSLNINNVDLPRFEYIWFKGFKWKGLFIQVVPQNKSKYIINEIKALNYFFLDYLQIIDKFRHFQNNKNPLSNYIIFPLISYAVVNGFILYASSLISLENNLEHEQSLFVCLDEIIKENKGYLRLYSNLNNISYYISVNTNKNFNQNKIINKNNVPKLLTNLMDKHYNVKDLLCSVLFSNLNIYHFLTFQQEKYLIFNLAEFIPKLFETKINSLIKINLFSTLNNIRYYYSMEYDLNSKKIIEKDKENKNNKLNPLEIIKNIYKINIKPTFKKKDITICGVQFRIVYESHHINNKNYKTKDFVDYLFNYENYNNTNKINYSNNRYESYVVEPYVILYDLVEPIKLKYALIKNKINCKNDDKNNNNISYYLNNNYLSYFLNWCKMINNNNFNIKNYSDLKQKMNQYGIDTNLKFFTLFILKNQDIIDIIKISILSKAIKFIINKKDSEKIITIIKNNNNYFDSSNYSFQNNYSNNNLFKDIHIARILYAIQSILYPNEILTKSKNFVEYFYQNLVFYINIIYIKYKLIDDHLSLGLLNTSISNNNKNIFYKFKEYESPKLFLKEIIKTSRKKPFLFIKELEKKLNFILNPYILFKSSLSIESMSKKLDIKQIYLNLSNITHSYIKYDEISGNLLAKIIYNFEVFERKINHKNFANKSIKFGEQYDADGNINFIQNINNVGDNNNNDQNYVDNESHNSTYDSRKNNIIDYDNISFMTSKINISDSLNFSPRFEEEKNIKYKSTNHSSIIHELLCDFIIQLPSNCYKMYYTYENLKESSLLINKYKNSKESQIYKNLKPFYNIQDKKILDNWIKFNENLFHNIPSCNGNIQHILMKLYIYQLIISFFIEKSIDESKEVLEKIKLLYKNSVGYLISLNDLSIINIFEGLIKEKNNELSDAEKESYYSKSLMLLLMNYGDPRGRNNDSHEILLFSIWKLLDKICEREKDSVMIDYFKEMFLSLDFIEKNKLEQENNNKFEDSYINNIFYKNENDNDNINIKELNDISPIKISNNILMDSLNIDSININKNQINKNIEENNEYHNLILRFNKSLNKELFLDISIFNNNSIINKISSKYYPYPLIDVFDSIDENNLNNCEKQFFSKEFILYFMKVIQNLIASNNEIIFEEKYINEIISNDLLYQVNIDNNKNSNIKSRKSNIPYQIKKSKSQKKISISKTETKEKKENKNLNFRNNSEKCIKRTNSCLYNIFSHFLYIELLQKLSYKLNAPSGVIISFGNNSHNETALDKTDKITTPHIVYKLKNEIINYIYAGWQHNIVITNNGEIFSFGHNQFCQCGLPNPNKMQENIKDPINLSIINNDIRAISASCGNEHTLILSKDHTVYSFGNNEEGVLGIEIKDNNNKNDLKEYKFNKINFGEYTNKIIEISSGTVHNLALTYDGKIFSWGSSQGGQLGLTFQTLETLPGFKNNYYISTPIHIPINKKEINTNNENNEINIIKISCGEAHSLALSSEGKVYSWGFGSNGQLGLGFCEDSFEPGEGLKNSMRYNPEKIEEINDENICDIKCGKTFSMFINNKGELFACGVNDLNQLGIQEMPPKHHLYNKNEEMCYDFVVPTKVDYFLNMKVENISCGEGHCLAIIKDILSNTQTIWSWGNNKFGQLGQGTIIKKCLPRPINCLFEYNSYKFDKVACGGFHSLCLIKHNENLNWIEDDYKKIICIIIDDIGII